MASISFFSSSIFFSSPKPASSSSSKFHSYPLTTLTLNPKTPTPISCKLATIPVISFTGEQIGETFLNLKTARPEMDHLRYPHGSAEQTPWNSLHPHSQRSPWRRKETLPQKKTGHARRGSQRTQLQPGGGVVFGLKPRDWSININKKEKRLTISTVIIFKCGSLIRQIPAQICTLKATENPSIILQKP